MLTKDFIKMEAKQVKPPLLMNGEDSSPSCFDAVIFENDAFEEATLLVYLVDDSTIGYFRDGDFVDYNIAGAKIELVKDSSHLSEPETEIFETVAYSEKYVQPFRNENGKIHRQGLKELGTMAALEYLASRDL